MIESILALSVLLGALTPDDGTPPDSPKPAAKKQEERPPEPVPPPTEERPTLLLEDEGLPWIDFDWLDLEPRIGLGVFSEDYKIDPSPYFSLLAHVPITCFSPNSDPEGDYFGLFGEVTFFPSVERDLNPEPSDPSGSLLFFTMGFDFTFLRNQTLYLVVQGGAQFGWHGGISDMNDGLAGVAGLAGGIYIGKGLTLTLGSEVVFAHAGDRIYLNSLGLMIEF